MVEHVYIGVANLLTCFYVLHEEANTYLVVEVVAARWLAAMLEDLLNTNGRALTWSSC